MFKGLIENYIQYLTPQLMEKYALQNGIILTPQEAKDAVDFIKQNYTVVLYQYSYPVIVELTKNHFKEESQEKMLLLLENTKKRYKSKFLNFFCLSNFWCTFKPIFSHFWIPNRSKKSHF